jgi:aquaporin NIP
VIAPALVRRAAAEGIGTFALVFAGCGAIVTDAERDGALGVVGVGLVFFLVLLAAIAALGHISGAHFNPGVSLSFFLTRHLPARDLAAFWAGQFLGATAAGLLLLAVWPGHPADLGATMPSIATGRALVLEAVLTAFLMLVIMSVATDTRAVGAPAALAIAAAVGLAAIAFGPHRRVAEHRPLVRAGARLRPVARLLALRRRPARRRAARRRHLPVRPRREPPWRPPCSSACITPGARR